MQCMRTSTCQTFELPRMRNSHSFGHRPLSLHQHFLCRVGSCFHSSYAASSPQVRQSTNSTNTPSTSAPTHNLQLLRSLRQESMHSRHHRHNRSRCDRSCHNGDAVSAAGVVSIVCRPFSPPDEWDDTGLFTVAPRPKTVPSGTTRRRHQHTLATPMFGRPSSPPLLPPSIGDSSGALTAPPDDLWSKTPEFGGASGGGLGGGFGLWPRRRRKARWSLMVVFGRIGADVLRLYPGRIFAGICRRRCLIFGDGAKG